MATKKTTTATYDAQSAQVAINAVSGHAAEGNKTVLNEDGDYIFDGVNRGMIPNRGLGMDTEDTDLARSTTAFEERMFRGLGKPVKPGMNTSDVLKAVGLDWEPAVSNLRYGGMFQHLVDSDQVLYRPSDGQYMGIVPRGWYDSTQSFASIVDLFKDFCAEASISLERVGVITKTNGKAGFASRLDLTLFAVARIDGSDKFTLPGNDLITGKLILSYPYIYGKGINVSQMSIRKICTNGMTMPVRVGNKIITHRSAVNHDRVLEALQGAQDCWGRYQQTAETLAETAIDVPTATLKLIEAFGVPGAALEHQPKVVQHCIERFQSGAYSGSEMLSAYDTAWGLLNTVTEHFNWQIKGTQQYPERALSSLMSTDASSRNGQQLSFMESISSFAWAEKQKKSGQVIQAVAAW